ncbi:MAG: magnesium-translocating P-type ATPase [Spirochaetes bacterium]|nr:magnesium-translocating P-type ATPase [Spirochaetota bacterium]
MAARSSRKSISQDEQRFIRLCTCPIHTLWSELNTSPLGLSEKEASKRLAEVGKNEVPSTRKLGFWADIFERIKSPLVIQLLVIAGISFLIGEIKSSVLVAGMIFLSVGLSYILDTRSSREVEALGKRVQSRTYVLRNGNETEVRMAEIVPGDIVLLQAGSIIPADVRLIAAKDFFVTESALTGESLPVEKSASFNYSEFYSALQLPNACFWGTSVTSGTARAVVIHTGKHTLFGALSQKLIEQRDETSFERGIRSFTYLMIRTMLVLVFSVFLIVGLTKGRWLEALLFALSVAVGLTPEMLPMILTVNLAKGALTMAKKKVIVKKLPSIQNLGAINILCTDKTGTLTQDRVILEHHVDITGNPSEEVLNYAYLNSFFQTGLKNLLDRAVIEHADLDVEECRLVDELPFDFQRRRMSVVVEYKGNNVLICKGAVEEIYSCCTHYQIEDEIYPLIDMIQVDLFEEVQKLNEEGFRVLGIAYREFPIEKKGFSVQDESQLILLGYIAFMDPPKDSALEAIKLLHRAGVSIKVLTGDNERVTVKVCRDVGIPFTTPITGWQLSSMNEEQFSKTVKECNVFVKLTPLQKEQIVNELRAQGNVVGYLGDGINDAPALKAADVGISVDSAVDVAKEAADIVLLEKNLLVLEEGILEGRKIFTNIIKYIRMGASSNFGNMFSVLGASYLFPFLPMKPIQILTNNLLYDLSQTSIPMDRVDEEQIAKPITWNIQNIKRFMIYIGPISSIFDYATFGLMWFVFDAKQYLSPILSIEQRFHLEHLFQTGWFVESLLTQTLIVHIIRTRKIPFIQSRSSPSMFLMTLFIMGIGIWLPNSPFAPTLGFVPLPPGYWVWIACFLLTYALLTHLVKSWFVRKYEGVS